MTDQEQQVADAEHNDTPVDEANAQPAEASGGDIVVHSGDATGDEAAPEEDPEGEAASDDQGNDQGNDQGDDSAAIAEPDKVMRIAGSVKRLLDEVRELELDEGARARLAQIHTRSVKELETGLSEDLAEELERITLPFAESETPPSEAELRIAQAQLVGWLEGLFHGIQTAMMAHQIAAAALGGGGQKGLPQGVMVAIAGPDGGPGGIPGGMPGAKSDEPADRPGQYL